MAGDAGVPRDGTGDGRKAQLLKGLAELALLSLLEDGPHYGLEILDRLRAEAGLPVAEGTIYPLLHRLERSGLIRSTWRIDEGGGRPRKYYELEANGVSELRSLAEEWRRLSTGLSAFLDRR